MLTTAVHYANEMLDGYSAFTLFKDQSKILGLNEFLRFKNVYQTRKFGEQTSRILELKPEGLDF